MLRICYAVRLCVVCYPHMTTTEYKYTEVGIQVVSFSYHFKRFAFKVLFQLRYQDYEVTRAAYTELLLEYFIRGYVMTRPMQLCFPFIENLMHYFNKRK